MQSSVKYTITSDFDTLPGTNCSGSVVNPISARDVSPNNEVRGEAWDRFKEPPIGVDEGTGLNTSTLGHRHEFIKEKYI